MEEVNQEGPMPTETIREEMKTLQEEMKKQTTTLIIHMGKKLRQQIDGSGKALRKYVGAQIEKVERKLDAKMQDIKNDITKELSRLERPIEWQFEITTRSWIALKFGAIYSTQQLFLNLDDIAVINEPIMDETTIGIIGIINNVINNKKF